MDLASDWFDRFHPWLWLLGARGADNEGQARLIRKLLRLRRGQRVLDVPCGRGRISFQLGAMGMEVVGVDANRQFVKSARERFRRQELRGSMIVDDMRRIDFCAEFHGAFNWFGSFGYFSDMENAEFLQSLVRAIRPGGRLLVEQGNRERMLRSFLSRIEDASGVRITNRWDARTQRIEGTWVTVKTGADLRCACTHPPSSHHSSREPVWPSRACGGLTASLLAARHGA